MKKQDVLICTMKKADIFKLILAGEIHTYECKVCGEHIIIDIADDLAKQLGTTPTKAKAVRAKAIQKFQDAHLLKHGLAGEVKRNPKYDRRFKQ